jgi:DNA-binding MarR family transcriptional regulator
MQIDWKKMESVVLLIRSGRIAANLLEEEITSLQVSVPQLSIILSLNQWGEMTASQLCELTMRDKANISSLTKKLEASGLIQQKKNESDARSTLIMLTAKGKKIADLGEKAEAKISKKLEKLSTNNKFPKEFLLELLEKNP